MIGDTYVLTRPDDLVVLRVTFQDFTAGRDAAGVPVYLAQAGAALVITFPPQVAQEFRRQPGQDLASGEWAEFVGATPSCLRFEPPTGFAVTPTAEGVLAALAALTVSARPRPRSGPVPKPPPRPPGPIHVSTAPPLPGPEPTPTSDLDVTLLDLPAGLTSCPVPADPTAALTVDHPVTPRLLGSSTALWQTELLAPSGLRLRPDGWYSIGGETPPPGQPDPTQPTLFPLADLDRQTIVAYSAPPDDGTAAVLPTVDRLRLSTLGATLTVGASWPDLTWQHDVALGRERLVRVTERGWLFPFGHAATRIAYADRHVDGPGDGAAAVHVDVTVLADPVRDLPDDGTPLSRGFPFHRVEILTPVLDGLTEFDPGGLTPIPLIRDGAPVQVPVRIHGAQGPFETAVEMYFIAATAMPAAQQPHVEGPLSGWSFADLPIPPVSLPALRIDLVRAAAPLAADVHEVHELTFGAATDAAAAVNGFTSFRPTVDGLKIALPALRAMLPATANSVFDAVLSPDLLANGELANSVLSQVGTLVPGVGGAAAHLAPLVVDFGGAPDRAGALVSPSFAADTVGREVGPIAGDLLDFQKGATAAVPDLRSLFKGSTLLGLDLADILPDAKHLPVPSIIEDAADAAAGLPRSVSMQWRGLTPGGTASFLPGDDVSLDVTATASLTAQSVQCVLRGFTLSLPTSADAILTLAFTAITFSATKGTPPTLSVDCPTATLQGALELLQKLEDAVDFGGAGQVVHVDESGITASYAVSVPNADAGAFLMRNIDFRTEVDVPFTGAAPSVTIQFASRDNPFTLAVLAFGGGGYVDLVVDTAGVRQFEASLDFAAQLAVDFVIAAGEVHALGGAEFDYDRDTDHLTCTGFLRFGGSLSVLQVVTVSVELRIDLSYADKTLSGSASLVIDVDVTVWSDSVELSTGTWVLAGGADSLAPQDVDDEAQLAAWRVYRAAFAA